MYQSLRDATGKAQTRKGRGFSASLYCLIVPILLAILCDMILGQAGRRQQTSNQGGVLVSVVARRDDKSTGQITGKHVAVYDNGVEQTIKISILDPCPPGLSSSLTIP